LIVHSLFHVLLISLSLAGPTDSVPTRFEAIAKQADVARSQNRVPDAIRLYREGTHLHPSWTEGWWYLGSLLYDQDRFSEATIAFHHLLASTAHRSPAHAFLGLCEYETGQYDDALAQFRAWTDAGWLGTPQLRNVAVFHFALLLTRDGKFVESLYLLATEAQVAGNRPELAEAMGLASLRMRSLPKDYPPDRRERVWLAGKAALYAAQSPKDFERADEFAARLEARYPAQPEVHFFRATLYGFEGKQADAEREYREELRISRDHVPSLVALTAIDLEKAQVAEAQNLARQAVEVDPKNAEAHHLLGRILLANGDLRASASELERAKQLAPDSPAVRSHLAMAYTKLGRMQEAKAEAAAFLALKNKEEVMAPPGEKLGEMREKTH
jgi:tetratricopeptide (TPR) repeat protein